MTAEMTNTTYVNSNSLGYLPLPPFAGFLASSPAIPQFYWDVYSQEQRWKEICCRLKKLAEYADELNRVLGETITTLNKFRAEYDKFVEATNAELEKINENIDAIEADIIAFKAEVAEFKELVLKEFTEVNNAIHDLNLKVERYKEELDKTISDLDTKVETYKKEIDEDIKELDDRVEKYKVELDEAIENLNSKVEDYKQKLDEDIVSLNTKVENYKVELDEEIDSLDTELDNLNTKVENYKVEAKANLDEAIGNLNAKVDDYVQKLTLNIEEIDTKVETYKTDTYEKIDSLNTQIEEKIIELKGEYAPINHASEETKYGVGTTTEYGHLKIWDGGYPFPQKDDSVACSGYYASLLNYNITTGLAENKKLIAEITPTVLFEQESTTGENNYQVTINTSLNWEDFETIQIFYIDTFTSVPRISSATVTNVSESGDEVALNITDTIYRTTHSIWKFNNTNILTVARAWTNVVYMKEGKEIVFSQVDYDVTTKHRECPIYVTKIIGIEKKQDND